MKHEIVGAKIGNILTNNTKDIIKAVESNTAIEWLDRKRMQFMAACDLGLWWERMAQSKTLFYMDENGNKTGVSDGE